MILWYIDCGGETIAKSLNLERAWTKAGNNWPLQWRDGRDNTKEYLKKEGCRAYGVEVIPEPDEG